MIRLNFVEKYLDRKTIILDRFLTYPKHVRKLIRTNKNLIQQFSDNYLNKINPFYKEFYNLIEEIRTFLIKNSYKILSFHATNLLKEEVEFVKKKGLTIFNEKTILEKVNLLKNYSFTKKEIDLIITNSKIYKKDKQLNDNRLGVISFFHSIDNFFISNEYNLFLTNWGGEILNKSFDKIPKRIRKKLEQMGTPYIVVTKLNIEDLGINFNDLLRNLVMNYTLDNHLHFDTDTAIIRNTKITDIFEIKKDNINLLL